MFQNVHLSSKEVVEGSIAQNQRVVKQQLLAMSLTNAMSQELAPLTIHAISLNLAILKLPATYQNPAFEFNP